MMYVTGGHPHLLISYTPLRAARYLMHGIT